MHPLTRSSAATSPAVPVPARFAAVHAAWLRARRGKKPSQNQLQFERRWLDGLLALTTQLQQGAWQPSRTVSFVVTHPKTREIHAPEFADRVVHHLLVSRLEPLYEPIFIHDSFANRKGKGSHGAVDRLQTMLRQRDGARPVPENQVGWVQEPTLHNTVLTNPRRVGFSPPSAPLPASEVSNFYPNGGLKPTLQNLCQRGGLPLAPENQVGSVSTNLHNTVLSNPRRVGFSPPSAPSFVREERGFYANGGLKPTLQNPPNAQNTQQAPWVQEPTPQNTLPSTPHPTHYLQLDIHNFFNSIHRPTLYAQLCQRLDQCTARQQLSARNALALRSVCHKLLAQKAPEHVRNHAAAAGVPPHKRLANAQPHCGLPVGNLSSQFFANVYLNQLDQFVKHVLKVRHYVRYVDDFVLLSHCRTQLVQWHQAIAHFLQSTLKLRLNAAFQLHNASQGIDFLGYRVYTHHSTVRPRVVQHCKAKLAHWQRTHAQPERVSAADFAKLQAVLASYWGHFSHAHSVRLRACIFASLPWLRTYFELSDYGQLSTVQPSRWLVKRMQQVRHILNSEPSVAPRRVGFSPPSSHGSIPLVG